MNIDDVLFSKHDPLKRIQIDYFKQILRSLLRRYDKVYDTSKCKPVNWPEFSAFIDAGYVCGFVCSDFEQQVDDGGSIDALVHQLEFDPQLVQTLTGQQIRHVVHHIIRCERWNDGGSQFGGGCIWDMLESGLGHAMADALDRL
jgi:hypothetical protein